MDWGLNEDCVILGGRRRWGDGPRTSSRGPAQTKISWGGRIWHGSCQDYQTDIGQAQTRSPARAESQGAILLHQDPNVCAVWSERRPNLPLETPLKARTMTSLQRGTTNAHPPSIGRDWEAEKGHPSASSAKAMVTSWEIAPVVISKVFSLMDYQ